MKNWKRVIVAAVAAVLLVTAAAAAVPGLSQRLLDYLGVEPEDAQTAGLLAPGAVAVDVTVEDNGAALHITQVLRDRYTVMFLADFTAPEGTELYMGKPDTPTSSTYKGFGTGLSSWAELLDETGERIGDELSCYYGWDLLEDDDPLDNRISLVGMVYGREEGLSWDAAFLRAPVVDLKYYDSVHREYVTVYSGDWSFEIPMPQKDIGWTLTTDQVFEETTGEVYSLRGGEMYLSPLTLMFNYRFEYRRDSVGSENSIVSLYLTTVDGETVDMKLMGGGGDGNWHTLIYFPTQVIDPAKFQGGTITLNWTGFEKYAVTMPIYDLTPVDP